ncbi:DMT family transporter [Paenibacillus sp. FSL H8-0537]|uniref:DMT family transporter n=1 Tax=Paenibacillus sp. FSL H8-0537 TaxID=2921399 RepID=UPI003100E734
MKPRNAELLIVLATVFWGCSYLFMKIGLESIAAFNLIALRFGLAFLLTSLLFWKSLRKVDWRTIKYSAMLGFLLFAVFACIMFGLKTTTTSNAGFLVSMTVIFVPLLSVILFKQKLAPSMKVSVLLALVGIGLLTLKMPFSIGGGDVLCMLSAVFYALYIILTNSAAKASNTLNLGILQLGFAGGFGLIGMLLFETPTLPQTPASWGAVLALSLLCSGFGFIIQPIAQKYTTPTRTGLIFSLEPVFAAAVGFWFAHEILPPLGYVGAAFVLLAVVASEIKWKRRDVAAFPVKAKDKVLGRARENEALQQIL